MLRELLTTWENWNARDSLLRALDRASTDEVRGKLNESIAATTPVDPLDALRDVTELVALLTGWQWQVVHAARVSGATWEAIGAVTGTTAADARAAYAAALDMQERARLGGTRTYRQVL